MIKRSFEMIFIFVLILCLNNCQNNNIRKNEGEDDVDDFRYLFLPFDISFKEDFYLPSNVLDYTEGQLTFIITADSLGRVENVKITHLKIDNKSGELFNSNLLNSNSQSGKVNMTDSILYRCIEKHFKEYFDKNVIYTKNKNEPSLIGAFQYYEILFTSDHKCQLKKIR
jgi:hypothetical protein